MNPEIILIGAGEIGQAIERVLQKKSGININLWDKDSAKVSNQKPLAEIIPRADFIFICVPSWATREVITNVLPYLNKKTTLISLSKGIEKETHRTMDELLAELLPLNQPFALLSGPMLAEELMQGIMGVGVLASKKQDVFNKLNEFFVNTNLNLEYSSDIHGIALAGVLKNIYTLALGIANGLELGSNTKGWFTAKAVEEMVGIVETLGGKGKTVMGTAGVGDFVATAFSPYSRNRQVGDELVKTGKCCLKSEGSVSLSSIIFLLGEEVEKYSLLKTLNNIIIQNKDTKTTFEQFLKRKTD